MGIVAARIGVLVCGVALAVGVSARGAEPSPAALPASSAVLMVDVPAGVAGEDAEAALRRRVNTHVATLRSEQHLRRVISSPDSLTRKTAWFKSAENPAERTVWLRDHLRAAAVPGTPLIEVTLTDVADAGDRREILMDVCARYMEDVRKREGERMSDRVQMLTGYKIKTEIRLRDLLGEMRERQIKVNVDGGGIGRIGMKEIELSRIVDEQVALRAEVNRRSAEVTEMNQAVTDGRDVPAVEAAVEADARVAHLRGLMDDAGLRADLAKAKAGEKDAAVAQALAEEDVYKRRLGARRAEVRARVKAASVADATAKLAVARGLLETNAKYFENLRNDVGELSAAAVQYRALEDERKNLLDQLRAVKRQIDDAMGQAASSSEAAGVRWHLMPEAR